MQEKSLKKNKQEKRNIFNLEPQEKVDILFPRMSDVVQPEHHSCNPIRDVSAS